MSSDANNHPLAIKPATATSLVQLVGVCFKIAPTDTAVFDDDIYTIHEDTGGRLYLKNIVCRLTALVHDVNAMSFQYGILFCNRLHTGTIFYSQLLPTTYTRHEYFKQFKTQSHAESYRYNSQQANQASQATIFNAHA